MWPFNKKKSIRSLFRDEEPEEEKKSEELPSFDPEIEFDTGSAKPSRVRREEAPRQNEVAPRQSAARTRVRKTGLPEENGIDEPATEAQPILPDAVFEDFTAGPVPEPDELPEEVPEEEKPAPSLTEEESPEPERPEDPENDPGAVFERLRALPLSVRTYALCEDRMLLCAPDGAGGLYLFEEYGDYRIVSPDRCRALVRLDRLGGVFRGKEYLTDDFAFVSSHSAWPLTVQARSRKEYDAATADGFVPYRNADDGKGVVMLKEISLYRMKDLYVEAEVTVTTPSVQGERCRLELTRSDLEEADGERHFRKLCKSLCERILAEKEDLFFTVLVQKVRRNLVLCTPLVSTPAEGDILAGKTITAVGQTEDGALILQLGQDVSGRIRLSEGAAERGQRRIVL